MALYQPKAVPTVDILILPDGSGMLIRDGALTKISKADIEAQYVPFVPK